MKRLTQGVGGTTRTVVVAVICTLVVAATGAVAAELITGKDIKNNTIALKDLKQKVRNKINKGGTAGAQGQQGPQGPRVRRAQRPRRPTRTPSGP